MTSTDKSSKIHRMWVLLKWINENIAAFGGDPENVTICGHSGGGGKVQCLFQLKDAAPYFQRGIVLSGARSDEAYHLDDGTASRETAKKMMDYLGINKDNIQKVKLPDPILLTGHRCQMITFRDSRRKSD